MRAAPGRARAGHELGAATEDALPPWTVALLEQAATTPHARVALPPARPRRSRISDRLRSRQRLPARCARGSARPADRSRRRPRSRRSSWRRSTRSARASRWRSRALRSASRCTGDENEARFASLVQNASDLITVVDRDGTRDLPEPVDPAHPRPHRRRRRRNALREPPGPGRPRPAARAPADDRHDASRSHAFDCTLIHRDGRALKFEVVATDLLDDEHVRGIVLNGRDASERARSRSSSRTSRSTTP